MDTLDQARRARFEDPTGICVTAAFTQTGGGQEPGSQNHDYDDPTSARLDPDSIEVKGITHVGGVDIGYDPNNPTLAIVVLVILTYPELKLKHTFKNQCTPQQPYVPSFLSMRELAPVLEVYDLAMNSIPPSDRPDVIFVDGFGRWHERQAGLAVALGVERGIVTIGIGKEYQPLRPDLGNFAQSGEWPTPMPPWPKIDPPHFRSKQSLFRQRAHTILQDRGDFLSVPLYRGGPIVGAALYSARRLNRTQIPAPVYVSPGNLTSLESAIALTMTCCTRKGVRLPEPIVLADRIGRDELRKLARK